MFRHTQLSHFLKMFHIPKISHIPIVVMVRLCGIYHLNIDSRWLSHGFPLGNSETPPRRARRRALWRRLSKRFSMSRLAATTCARFWFGSGGPWAWDIAGIHCQHHMQYILCVCVYMCVYMYVYSYIHM